MDLTRYVEDLQRRLATAAGAGGEDAQLLAERLTAPLDAAVRLVLLDALSAAAGEISADLAPGSVDVRLRGGEPEFVVAGPPTQQAVASSPAGSPSPATSMSAATSSATPGTSSSAVADVDTGTATRTTLRLPDHLKTQVEAAAARDQLSVNSWLVRAVAAALEQGTEQQAGRPRTGQQTTKHVSGWVR